MIKTIVDISSWNIFNDWHPPKEKDTLSWEVFDVLFPLYRNILKKKYSKLNSLLKDWDSRLKDLGGDPTHFNWDTFRPLRLSREEDWSDWLSCLIATSERGILSKTIFTIDGFKTKDYASPSSVEREVIYENYRADIIIKWKNYHFSHLEVKIGDEQLQKTLDTGEKLREKYSADETKWTNYILLLRQQKMLWEQLTIYNGPINLDNHYRLVV